MKTRSWSRVEDMVVVRVKTRSWRRVEDGVGESKMRSWLRVEDEVGGESKTGSNLGLHVGSISRSVRGRHARGTSMARDKRW